MKKYGGDFFVDSGTILRYMSHPLRYTDVLAYEGKLFYTETTRRQLVRTLGSRARGRLRDFNYVESGVSSRVVDDSLNFFREKWNERTVKRTMSKYGRFVNPSEQASEQGDNVAVQTASPSAELVWARDGLYVATEALEEIEKPHLLDLSGYSGKEPLFDDRHIEFFRDNLSVVIEATSIRDSLEAIFATPVGSVDLPSDGREEMFSSPFPKLIVDDGVFFKTIAKRKRSLDDLVKTAGIKKAIPILSFDDILAKCLANA